jgi:hypothetical protein
VIEGITRALGDTLWANTFVGLTHGRLTSLPDGLAFGAPSPWPPTLGRPARSKIPLCMPALLWTVVLLKKP